MGKSSSASTRTIVAIVVVAALAIGFWVILLSPKRDKASELGTEVEGAQSTLAQAESAASLATAAQQDFDSDYRRLVALGKAVPSNEETSSLLVELTRIARRTHVDLQSVALASEAGGEVSVSTGTAQEAGPTVSVPASQTVPPTEAEAALLPLGATVGSAGLGVMPYTLTFEGGYFNIANFIHEIDKLVTTSKKGLGVDGRLVTIDGYALSEIEANTPGTLTASMAISTFLVPPSQGLTAGATEESPAPVTATPETTEGETTTATPSSFSTESESGSGSEAR